MKKTKRLLSMVLTLGLILTMLSPVSFAEGDGTITVDNPKDGQTYTLYRVFDLSYNSTVGAYTYIVAKNDLQDILFEKYPQLKSNKKITKDVNGIPTDFFIINAEPLIDKNYKYTPDQEEVPGYINPYDFSIWLNSLQEPEKKFAKHDTTKTGTVEWTGLELGYYMIKSTAGTVVSLTTTDREATVHEKNIKPTLTKQVTVGSATNFADLTYANIGEELTFKLTFDVHNHANTEYILKDVVPKGIDVTNTKFEVKLGTEEMSTELDTVQKLKYELTKNFTLNDPDDGKKNLELKFPLETIQAIADEIREDDKTVDATTLDTKKTITVIYTGKLNKQALMSNHTAFSGSNVNRNEAELKYDPNETIQPIKAHADVRTTEFQIKKFAKKSDTEEVALDNAKFKIYTSEDGTEPIKFSKLGTGEDYIYDTEGDVTEITTKVSKPANENTDGIFSIKGLKPGTYYIEESVAPDGFNPLQKRVQLTIAATNGATNISYTLGTSSEVDLTDSIVKIENKSGAELPETGGIGRTIIYTLGALLFFGALILLVARKKTKEQRA